MNKALNVQPTLLLAFTVPGDPIPMERVKTGAQGQRYTPPRSRYYRAHVQRHLAYIEIPRDRFDFSPQQWRRREGVDELKLAERVELRVRLYFSNFRSRDNDNCLKAIQDAIVKSGALGDDNFKVLGRTSVDADIDRQNPRAEIELHRMPPLAAQPKKRRRR